MKFAATLLATFIGLLWCTSLCLGLIASNITDPTWHGIAIVVLWMVFGSLAILISGLAGTSVGLFVDTVITDWQNERARQRRHKNKKV